MLSLPKFGLSKYAEKHVFGSFNLNNSEKYRLFFEDIFWGTLGTYTKKMNIVLEVVHGKLSWLIVYKEIPKYHIKIGHQSNPNSQLQKQFST